MRPTMYRTARPLAERDPIRVEVPFRLVGRVIERFEQTLRLTGVVTGGEIVLGVDGVTFAGHPPRRLDYVAIEPIGDVGWACRVLTGRLELAAALVAMAEADQGRRFLSLLRSAIDERLAVRGKSAA